MRQQRPAPISEHYLARITTWLASVLLWFVRGAPLKRSGHRHRDNIPITKLRRAVRDIILIHTAQLLRAPEPRPFRDSAAKGFRLRRKRLQLRACGGAWLRRQLRAQGGFIAQVRHLFAALTDVRRFAAQLAKRRQRGLKRLRVLSIVAPPAEACMSLNAPAPPSFNSS